MRIQLGLTKTGIRGASVTLKVSSLLASISLEAPAAPLSLLLSFTWQRIATNGRQSYIPLPSHDMRQTN